MLSKKVMNDIEEYLYIYPNFEQKIEDIKRESEIVIKRDVNSWIKSKGKINNSVECQALLELITEEKINKCLKWKAVIEKVMKIFSKYYPERYLYINLKYKDKCTITKIEMKSCMSKSTQSRIKQEILYYIAIFAFKENLIKLDEEHDI